MRSFADAVEALSWIEVGDCALLEDLDRLPRVCPIHASVLVDVRRLLDERPANRAEEVARQFGVSQRTFQRRLRELGTSFQQEVNAAHVRIAKKLMRETGNQLKWIAIQSGYASLQHFSSSFHTQVGVSPSRWRVNKD